ncbi:MAG: NAD(P)-dependent glycerol-3-phosphate dehydrogenase [Gammaproteobacteria bacterium]|nr:NAD(P)-dependent glycerol-3-phosphate dehydrogenase [Gammaproteobacteria bacterium]
MTQNITVLGAGSWGTALALLLARNQHLVTLWARNAEHVSRMEQQRCNAYHLPDFSFPDNLSVTANLETAVSTANLVLIAIPSEGFRSLLKTIKPYLNTDAKLVYTTKGLESGTHKLLHQVIQEELGDARHCALLTGPSFAQEVAANQPTAVVIASNDQKYANDLITLFANQHFRPYYTQDVIGAEVGGAVKNVMAVGAGISDGLGFGANARAALITRGLSEMTQLGMALGAQRDTFMGLSGLGDLVLTCTDNLSRNRRFGLALGQGRSIEAALKEIGQVVEGALNAQQVHELAKQHHIEMPLTAQVCKVLTGKITPRAAVEALFERKLKAES